VKLSDAIEAGTLVLKTQGPTFKLDAWDAAAAGILGAPATHAQVATLYWNNPWCRPGDDLEMWLRIITLDRPRWFVVLSQLRNQGW
jgi:hypothetical protein